MIEFADESLFAEAANRADVDMHEENDSSGAKETPTTRNMSTSDLLSVTLEELVINL